jgi:hypothetical protein
MSDLSPMTPVVARGLALHKMIRFVTPLHLSRLPVDVFPAY